MRFHSVMLLQWALVALCCSVVAFIFVKYRRKSYGSLSVKCDPDQKVAFDKLQYSFLTGFCSASFADWLYGPYIYKLYLHYGYDSIGINALYISGFFSSMFFGPVVGYLADAYGRRNMCVIYTVFGIMSSLCKVSLTFCCVFKVSVSCVILISLSVSVVNILLHLTLRACLYGYQCLYSIICIQCVVHARTSGALSLS